VFPNGTWSFPALGWTGGTGTITVVSPAQVVAAIKGGLTFSNPTGVNTLPGQGTVIAAVTAPDGHQVDLAGGGSDGVEVTPVVTGATVPGPVRFSGPPGTYSERITGSGALSETFDTSGYQVSVNASAGTDEVALDTSTGTISIGPAATGKASTTASLTVDQDTANGGVESATLTGSPAAGSIVLGFTGSGQATVTGSAHRARSLSLALANDVTGQAPQAFAAPLVVPGGDTATVEAPEWSSYTGGSLEAAVGPSGKATKEMTLANHSRPPVEPRVSRLSVSGKALFVSVSLPPLPPGSTVQVTTSFLSQEKKVEHKVTTSLAHLGHASARALRVPIPHHLLAGSTATATLIAVPAGASEVLTSSLSTRLAPHA